MPAAHRRVKHSGCQDSRDASFIIRGIVAGLPQDRPHGGIYNIFDDEIGRVVAAGSFALLAPAVEQANRPTVPRLNCFQVIFQQTLVNCAEIAHREVTVINKLSLLTPLLTRQHINGLLQTRIADLVALKKCMALRVKEAAVEGRDFQGRVADIDEAEEFFQMVVVSSAGWMRRDTPAPILRNSM